MIINLPERPGVCRICHCTETTPCGPVGCAWANRRQTLCTACVNINRALGSARGRVLLRDALHDAAAAAMAPRGKRR